MVFAGIVVLGLAPSLIVLAILLPMHEEAVHPKTWLMVLQLILFVFSVGTFLVFGGLGNVLSRIRK
jgi:hypothetical protein